MKVYTLTTHQVFDGCDDLGIVVRVFSTREKALNAFNNFVADEIEYAKQNGWTIEQEDMSFVAYEMGYYATNHTIAIVEQKTIE